MNQLPKNQCSRNAFATYADVLLSVFTANEIIRTNNLSKYSNLLLMKSKLIG